MLLTGPIGTNFGEILTEIQIFSHKKNAFENVVRNMAGILFRPQCVKTDFQIWITKATAHRKNKTTSSLSKIVVQPMHRFIQVDGTNTIHTISQLCYIGVEIIYISSSLAVTQSSVEVCLLKGIRVAPHKERALHGLTRFETKQTAHCMRFEGKCS